MARGAFAAGERVAFGDGRRIIWGPHAEQVYRGNPNVARPGEEGRSDLRWVEHYKGARAYARPGGRGWVWNMDFRPTPGEFFFDLNERIVADSFDPGFVLIEPTVPAHKAVAVNKRWRFERFQRVADLLRLDGHRVLQFTHDHGPPRGRRAARQFYGRDWNLEGVERHHVNSFRWAVSGLSRAALFIGHEGGMHHAAAAVGVPAVVIFGGFIPAQVTGYDTHVNLADPSGAPACGSTTPCAHCREALDAITAEQVHEAARRLLDGSRTDDGQCDRGALGRNTGQSSGGLEPLRADRMDGEHERLDARR